MEGVDDPLGVEGVNDRSKVKRPKLLVGVESGEVGSRVSVEEESDDCLLDVGVDDGGGGGGVARGVRVDSLVDGAEEGGEERGEEIDKKRTGLDSEGHEKRSLCLFRPFLFNTTRPHAQTTAVGWLIS